MDDFNNAIEEDGNEDYTPLSGNVWGSVANATKTGNTTEMQQKLAKFSEMKKQ
jgi:hypothetical protein